VTVNGGSDVTSDRLAITITYTHPAAPGVPIPWYRIRTWHSGRTAPNWGTYQANTQRTNVFNVQLFRAGMINPIPGGHTIEIQIKDAADRESAPRAVIVNRVVTAVAIQPVQHRVAGAEVAALLGFARLEGYLSNAEPLNANSECVGKVLYNEWTLYISTLNPFGGGAKVMPPRCRYRFFTGKALQPGWHLRSVNLQSLFEADTKWVFESPIKPSGTDASFAIVATKTAPGAHTWIVVKDFVFDGPPNANWRQAFKP
jgi:hypothetical protein